MSPIEPMKSTKPMQLVRPTTSSLTFAWRGVLLVIVLGTSVLVRSAMAVEARPPSDAMSKPNIVVVFIDDLGYADIGPFGATKQKTPHLDRMASEGMKLTSFYAAPVCSVSRAQLLTGCYGARVSVPGVFGPASAQGLHPDERTIADYLKPLGYATMCIGKWHVGDQPEFLPTRQGFDHYFGIPYSNDMQRKSSDTGQVVVPLVRDEQVVELLHDEQQRRLVERYTDEAVRFVRDNAKRPFLLYLPHSAVHTPIWPGEKFRGKSANGRFGDWVEEVDWSVGQILDTLRDLQIEQRTLVVFTSDNGPWLIKGADGGSAKPLRGGKGSTWEGGVRVPTIAWWPGKIAPGTTSDAVAGTIDLLPTAVSLAGGQIATDRTIDGRDLSPLLFGKSPDSPRDVHYYFANYNLQAVRQGPWKLAIAVQPETMGKDAAEDAKQNPRLYNLDQEIGEQTNLADKHPDVVSRLTKLAEHMNAEIGGQLPKARRPAGVVANPKTLYPTEAAAAAATKAGKPADLTKLRVGNVVPSSAGPQVAGRPWTLRVKFVAKKEDQGVLVAHGGSQVGYALFLREGKLHLAARDRGEVRSVAVSLAASDDARQVVASLATDGTLTLQLDGGEPATVKTPGLLTRQPQENFCVGKDDGAQVADYGTTDVYPSLVEILP